MRRQSCRAPWVAVGGPDLMPWRFAPAVSPRGVYFGSGRQTSPRGIFSTFRQGLLANNLVGHKADADKGALRRGITRSAVQAVDQSGLR